MRITGTLRDRHGQPLSGGVVQTCDSDGEDLAETTTDDQGRFRLDVDVPYVSLLFACKGYGEDNLEFWGGALEPCGQPGAAEDEVLVEAMIGDLEVYRLSAFEAERGLFVWFRPMALGPGLAMRAAGEPTEGLVDIAPQVDWAATRVTLDGEPVHLHSWLRTEESVAPRLTMPAYLVQVLPMAGGEPAWRRFPPGKHYLHVHLVDVDGQVGEAARVVDLR